MLVLGPLHDTRAASRARRADRHSLGAAVDRAADVHLVEERAPYRDRVPRAASEGGDPCIVEFAGHGHEAAALGVTLEDAAHDRRLQGFDLPAPAGRVVGVAVAARPGRLRDAATARPLFLAPHRALGDLLSLDLGDEGAGGEDEAPDRRVLEPLGHELQPCAGALELVEQHADVVLAAREAIDGEGDDHLGFP